jgi:hypothetical protein
MADTIQIERVAQGPHNSILELSTKDDPATGLSFFKLAFKTHMPFTTEERVQTVVRGEVKYGSTVETDFGLLGDMLERTTTFFDLDGVLLAEAPRCGHELVRDAEMCIDSVRQLDMTGMFADAQAQLSLTKEEWAAHERLVSGRTIVTAADNSKFSRIVYQAPVAWWKIPGKSVPLVAIPDRKLSLKYYLNRYITIGLGNTYMSHPDAYELLSSTSYDVRAPASVPQTCHAIQHYMRMDGTSSNYYIAGIVRKPFMDALPAGRYTPVTLATAPDLVCDGLGNFTITYAIDSSGANAALSTLDKAYNSIPITGTTLTTANTLNVQYEGTGTVAPSFIVTLVLQRPLKLKAMSTTCRHFYLTQDERLWFVQEEHVYSVDKVWTSYETAIDNQTRIFDTADYANLLGKYLLFFIKRAPAEGEIMHPFDYWGSSTATIDNCKSVELKIGALKRFESRPGRYYRTFEMYKSIPGGLYQTAAIQPHHSATYHPMGGFYFMSFALEPTANVFSTAFDFSNTVNTQLIVDVPQGFSGTIQFYVLGQHFMGITAGNMGPLALG